MRVDGAGFDEAYLDSFLERTRIFLSSARSGREAVAPFESALRSSGFEFPPGLEVGVAPTPESPMTSALRPQGLCPGLRLWKVDAQRECHKLAPPASSVGDRIVSVLLEPLRHWGLGMLSPTGVPSRHTTPMDCP